MKDSRQLTTEAENLPELPLEIWSLILSFLDIKPLLISHRVSKLWYRLTTQLIEQALTKFWKEKFNANYTSLLPEVRTLSQYKDLYSEIEKELPIIQPYTTFLQRGINQLNIFAAKKDSYRTIRIAVVNNCDIYLLKLFSKQEDIAQDLRTRFGLRLLNSAIKFGAKECFEVLLQQMQLHRPGIGMSLDDPLQEIHLLHHAIQKGKYYFVERLLKLGRMDITAVDQTGNKPLPLAYALENNAIFELLQQYIDKKDLALSEKEFFKKYGLSNDKLTIHLSEQKFTQQDMNQLLKEKDETIAKLTKIIVQQQATIEEQKKELKRQMALNETLQKNADDTPSFSFK